MQSISLGDSTLSWTRDTITLSTPNKPDVTLSPSGGGLRDGALDQDGKRAILATRSVAVLIDAAANTLVPCDFVTEIFGAKLGESRALICGNDRVVVCDIATATIIGEATPSGQCRAETALSMDNNCFACAFYDQFVVFNDTGNHAEYVVQSRFPILKIVGGHVLAAGRDLLVLVNFQNLMLASQTNTNGQINVPVAAFDNDLAAIPTRDSVYIVDGRGGNIAESRSTTTTVFRSRL